MVGGTISGGVKGGWRLHYKRAFPLRQKFPSSVQSSAMPCGFEHPSAPLQAGVAMGLARLAGTRFPDWGPHFQTFMVRGETSEGRAVRRVRGGQSLVLEQPDHCLVHPA